MADATTAVVPVPFLDLGVVHRPLKDQLLADIAALIDSGSFTNGPDVAAFEAAFATYCLRRHSVGTSSGLDALRVALLAAGIESGDEVIVPANTFVATVEAVTQAGGVPVLVDANESDYNLDVAAAETAVGPRTAFILPVHLYGQLADMRSLASLASRHRLRVVEDAAQAHGAERDGIKAGSAGLAAAFSFYPGKNLGAIGDAGAVVADDASIIDAVRALREHGQTSKYVHKREGFTARLDTIQAIALLHKLPLLDGWNDDRRTAAARYDEALADVGDLVLPPVPKGSFPVWHLYVVRTKNPSALGAFLAERNIGTGRHYPHPIHLTDAYHGLGYSRGAFPVAERLSAEVLSLPMFPGITPLQQEAVAAAVAEYFAR